MLVSDNGLLGVPYAEWSAFAFDVYFAAFLSVIISEALPGESELKPVSFCTSVPSNAHVII